MDRAVMNHTSWHSSPDMSSMASRISSSSHFCAFTPSPFVRKVKASLFRQGGTLPRTSVSTRAIIDGSGGEAPPASSSYLSMWKEAQERKTREDIFRTIQTSPGESTDRGGDSGSGEGEGEKSRREQQFFQMLQVPEEERRKVEQQLIVDRAAAALAAAQSLLSEVESKERFQRQVDRGRATASGPSPGVSTPSLSFTRGTKPGGKQASQQPTPERGGSSSLGSSGGSPTDGSPGPSRPADSGLRMRLGEAGRGSGGGGAGMQSRGNLATTPGTDFWTWVPPKASSSEARQSSMPPEFQRAKGATKPRGNAAVLELEKSRFLEASLNLPFQTAEDVTKMEGATTAAVADLEVLFKGTGFTLPPMQSQVQMIHVADEELSDTIVTQPASQGQTEGVLPDGSRWWRTTGTDVGPDGEVCEWTVVRGVSADGGTEWEEKWWEKYDKFDYKEMGAEKSGRNAAGGVWRESWQEATWQDKKNGLPHIEKSADKWGQDGKGGEWQEKWWEHYDGSGKAEKWADKWSKIDPNTPLLDGHGHVWHERWGEEYDGKGAASKFCDKWAERCVDVGANLWTKWGDKWDENFNRDAHGYKQGTTWWGGAWGEQWNRIWSEGHNGSGWVHKKGQSSSGEHWDVHEPMDTWYERKPHYGFTECMRQSHRLQQVGKKKKTL